MNKLDILNEIIKTKQAKTVKSQGKKVLIDTWTASSILLLYNALKKEENKKKFLEWDWEKIAVFAWEKCNIKF